LTGLFEAGVEGSVARDEMGEKKQATAKAAARFLYMVVLYMAAVEQKINTRRRAGIRGVF